MKGFGFGDIITVTALDEINNKMDKIINLLQGKPIDYKEPKIKKKKDKKKKE